MADPLPVLIDTDPAVGLPGRDVDDALALVQACRHPALDVRAVTAVFGNADLSDTYPLAQEVLRVAGCEHVPVARGAAGAHERETRTPAVDLIIDTLRSGPHAVLALGPLTNIAGALHHAPEIADRITELVFVGGRHPGVDFLVGSGTVGLMDLNFELDPAAAQVVLDQSFPLVFAGFEVSACLTLRPIDLAAVAARDTPVTRYLQAPMEAWLDHWHTNFDVAYFFPFDTLAVGYLTDPDQFSLEYLKAEIVEIDGRPFLHAVPEGPVRDVTFCAAVDAAPFRAQLLELLH